MITPDFDVLIVGSGVAGLSAAVAAREAGARSVLVAEAEETIGGSSRLSGAYIMGAGSRLQQEAGIEDTAEDLFNHYLTVNAWNLDVEVARRLCDESGRAIDWLADLGVEFDKTLIFGGDELVPRVHAAVERGQGVIEILYRKCRRLGVEFAVNRRVDRLILMGGCVTGVAVATDEITAHSVVIASGGFGNDPQLLEQYFPSASIENWTYYIGAPGSRGDHIRLGESVGAQLAGFDRGLRLLNANFDNMYESYLPGWLTLVNQDGRRFCDETAPYGILDSLVRSQNDRVWAIFDREALLHSTGLKNARYKQYRPTTKTRQSPHWITDIVDEMVRTGVVVEASTIDNLASQTGLHGAVLRGTVDRVNQAAAAGYDMDFGKAAAFLDPISVPPFYAAQMKPGTVCWTGYGLRIDRTARVLGNDGHAISGLFAAGECTSGPLGPVYVGSGNSYANCVTFGRIAGQSAAEGIPSTS